ncbi:hypothetical protein NTA49_12370 [Photobacterium sp. TY 1-4]|uniref:Uncharacterized protein n=1 Tax=Pseudosulfitobacter koreensis TaxID=2968472 RepID=A0ABT1Z2I9_9RHOB|nr:hypothetical protein [Pseudosulfitobacter koreense]MCR8827331.1 hypothetical protein [Pseudosulfitobacter koreense]
MIWPALQKLFANRDGGRKLPCRFQTVRQVEKRIEIRRVKLHGLLLGRDGLVHPAMLEKSIPKIVVRPRVLRGQCDAALEMRNCIFDPVLSLQRAGKIEMPDGIALVAFKQAFE